MKESKLFKVDELTLWDQNPRNDREFVLLEEHKTEKQIIEKMLENRRIFSTLPSLLENLLEEKEITEEMIIYQKVTDQGEVLYQTFDGNRRMLLLKLHKYPDLLEKYGFNKEKMHSVAQLISTVKGIYYESGYRSKALEHVKKRHYGLQDGKGQLDWDSDNKANIDTLLGAPNLSIGNLIIDFYKKNSDNPLYSEVAEHIDESPDKSTFDRIFGSTVISRDKFGLANKKDYDLNNPNHVAKMNEILNHFFNKTSGKVSDVYTNKLIESKFEEIKPISQEVHFEGYDLFTLDGRVKKDRKNNKYITKRYLYKWRSKGLDFADIKLKKILNLTIEHFSTKTVDQLKEFHKMTAMILYRVISELAIKEFIQFFNENKILFNIGHSDIMNHVNSMNTSIEDPAFNTKKIAAVYGLSKQIKSLEKKQKIEKCIKFFDSKKLNSADSSKLISFVDNIHSIVHGNSRAASETQLVEYDEIVLNLLLMVNLICKNS